MNMHAFICQLHREMGCLRYTYCNELGLLLV